MGMVLSSTGGRSAPLFSEDFGNLADGTPITVDNTALTYARVGTGAGAQLASRNPGNFAGASASLLATSTSLTGLGVTDGTYSPFGVGTFSFSFRTPTSFDATEDLYAFVGSGNTFSGNSLFSGNDLTAGLGIVGGQFRTRNSLNAWEDLGAPLLPGTDYDLSVVFNASGSPVAYGSESVAGGTADIWLNGTLFGDDVSIRNAVGVSAFRLYTTGSAGAQPFEIDEIRLYDSAVVVPEPSALALGALGTVLTIGFLYRRA
jgi:hypothetical protein